MITQEILAYTSNQERMEIAKDHGVTSRQAIYDLIKGKVKKPRQALLDAIVARAEENKSKALKESQKA